MSEKPAQTEFKNDNLTVHVTRLPHAVVKFDIQASPQAVQAAFHKAIKNVNKDVTVPGFRKGKAPEKYILDHYAKHIDQELKDIVINTGFQEALQLVNLLPFSRETIKLLGLKSVSKETGAEFSIQFESQPEIPHVVPQDISLKAPKPVPLTEKDVDNAIEDVRLYHAEWVEAPERPIQEGDFVDLDIESLEEGGGAICQDTRFEVRDGKMGAWMRKLLIGHKVHESVEGVSEKEDDTCEECGTEGHEHHVHTNFKPTRCRITIKSIKEAKKPELDDDFAKKVGLSQIADLRGRIKEDLERRIQEDMQTHMRHLLNDALLEKYPFELPASLIERDKTDLLEHKIELLRRAQISEDEIEKRRKGLEEEAKREIDENTRLVLLKQKIAREHNLSITKEEVMRELMRQTYMQPEDAVIHSQMDPEEMHKRIASYLIIKKAADYIIGNANIESSQP